jgi:putative SOS response-associated peptidase YedK
MWRRDDGCLERRDLTVCGRFSLAYEDWGEMLDYWGIINTDFSEGSRYNVAPGQEISAIIDSPTGHRIGRLKWGLVPNFAKDSKSAIQSINARLETALSKPMFRKLVTRRRCVIPADGFFEWKRSGSNKQPYRIVIDNRPFFGLAGLYDIWTGPDGTRLSTCLILTTKPNEVMSEIHDRMPVILTAEAEKVWLDSGITDGELACSLLGPYSAHHMRAYPVSPLVGNVRNDSKDCIVPLEVS